MKFVQFLYSIVLTEMWRESFSVMSLTNEAPMHFISIKWEDIAIMHCWCKSGEISVWVQKKKNKRHKKEKKEKRKTNHKKATPAPAPSPRFTDTRLG